MATRDHAEALTWFRQALTVRRAIGDRWGQGMTLAALAEVHRALGDKEAAREALHEAISILDDLGDPSVDEIRGRFAGLDLEPDRALADVSPPAD